jgi:hypothetical protein
MEDMKITAWAVKTPKGKIYPTWIFDNKEDAEQFAEEINERFRPPNHKAVECEITISPNSQ